MSKERRERFAPVHKKRRENFKIHTKCTNFLRTKNDITSLQMSVKEESFLMKFHKEENSQNAMPRN